MHYELILIRPVCFWAKSTTKEVSSLSKHASCECWNLRFARVRVGLLLVSTFDSLRPWRKAARAADPAQATRKRESRRGPGKEGPQQIPGAGPRAWNSAGVYLPGPRPPATVCDPCDCPTRVRATFAGCPARRLRLLAC